jgi:hypothetical protein
MSLNFCKDDKKQEHKKYKIKTPHPRVFLAEGAELNSSNYSNISNISNITPCNNYRDDICNSYGLIKNSFTTKDNSYIGDEKYFLEDKNQKNDNYCCKKISDHFVNFELLKKNKILCNEKGKIQFNFSECQCLA